jgi:hypothetical protein
MDFMAPVDDESGKASARTAVPIKPDQYLYPLIEGLACTGEILPNRILPGWKVTAFLF